MPAEWEAHESTWVVWPTNEANWPGKFETIKWNCAEIVRLLARSERVDVICATEGKKEEAKLCLLAHHVGMQNIRLHMLPTERGWLREFSPTCIFYKEKPTWIKWQLKSIAKGNGKLDSDLANFVSEKTKLELLSATRIDNSESFACQGGEIETDGDGTLLVTEESFLSSEHAGNPGLNRSSYERTFARTLGIEKVIWLKGGIYGDRSPGQIDNIARFVGPRTVLLAYEDDVSELNHEISVENMKRLNLLADAKGRSFNVVLLPMPRPIFFNGKRLPASYANFYIANEVVLVPTFNDPKDRLALNIIAQTFPGRATVGVNCVNLVAGLGGIHCMTQQQFRNV